MRGTNPCGINKCCSSACRYNPGCSGWIHLLTDGMFVSAAAMWSGSFPPALGSHYSCPGRIDQAMQSNTGAAIMSQQRANHRLLDLLQENNLSVPRADPECPPEHFGFYCEPAGALKQLQPYWRGRITFRMGMTVWRWPANSQHQRNASFLIWNPNVSVSSKSQLTNPPLSGPQNLNWTRGDLCREAGFRA